MAGRRIVINESVVCANVDGEAVLLDLERGIYYGLNAVGTEIWELVVHGMTEGDVLGHLLDLAHRGPFETAFKMLLKSTGKDTQERVGGLENMPVSFGIYLTGRGYAYIV